jgi:hypothetical protein
VCFVFSQDEHHDGGVSHPAVFGKPPTNWYLLTPCPIPPGRQFTDAFPIATKADVESFFAAHGAGEITEVKVMNGFGFIEYKDPMDARDVVPAYRTY